MSIREVNAVAITDAVEELCIRANTQLPPDVKQALDNAHAAEPWPLARQTLELLQQNLCVAAEKDLPICQDTGMACVFIELGQDVHINGNLDEAVNEGVRRGYEKAYLRKSITADPLQRVNTGDNTPAFLTVHLVPGDVCKITVAPKGAGSENMSRLTMLKPADGVQGVKDFVMETVKQAGANPCPPIVLGIGIGGSFDKCAALAKKALLRPLDQPNAAPYYAALEKEAQAIRARIPKGAAVVAMCVEGRLLSSEALAQQLAGYAAGGTSKVCFLVGGSFGLDEGIKREASLRLSMSPMTFPHHLARVMLAEQIYRACTINAGTQYHK